MTKNDLVEYFETYVKEYAPFKDNNVFQTLLSYLVDYYFDKLYNEEPKIFKTMFEDNIIPPEVYDKILVSIGLPQNLIDELNFNAKVIFLKSFSDFERYKSSISFVKNLAVAYNDFLGIYELYIDLDVETGEWILRPLKIYKHDFVNDLTEVIKYDDIYPDVPTLLVDSAQLTELNDNNQLILPLKSNLILLDYELTTHVSQLYNLFNSVFIKDYSDTPIPLYFNDFSYLSTIRKIVLLWYYLLTKFYDVTWKSFTLNYIVFFDTLNNPFSIEDLDNIKQEYDNIDNSKKLELFYKSYISPYEKYYKITRDYSETDFYNMINNSDKLLLDYLDERITSAENSQYEIQNITTEIYNSILISVNSSSDINFQKYSKYYLLNLSQLTFNPKFTNTYLILHTLKPFHTELVTESQTSIYVEDKFNQIFSTDDEKFLFKLMRASLLEFSINNTFDTTYNITDTQPILSGFNFIYDLLVKEKLYNIIMEVIHFNFMLGGTAILSLSDVEDFITVLNTLDSNKLISTISSIQTNTHQTDEYNNLIETIQHSFESKTGIYLTLSDVSEFISSINTLDSNKLISTISSVQTNTHQTDEYNNLIETIIHSFESKTGIYLTLSDVRDLFKLIFTLTDNIHLLSVISSVQTNTHQTDEYNNLIESIQHSFEKKTNTYLTLSDVRDLFKLIFTLTDNQQLLVGFKNNFEFIMKDNEFINELKYFYLTFKKNLDLNLLDNMKKNDNEIKDLSDSVGLLSVGKKLISYNMLTKKNWFDYYTIETI